jgi:glycine/D-amino acid oxidase-like deaminating enzyme
MTDYRSELIEKFNKRDAHVAVIGLGYVGLPLAVIFGEAGYRVTGIDVDRRKIEALNKGQSYLLYQLGQRAGRPLPASRPGSGAGIDHLSRHHH